MADVIAERIERAQTEFANGKSGQALGTLGDIVNSTKDPAQLAEMHTLAQQGLEGAGRFGKGGWKNLLAEIEKQQAASSNGH